MKFVSSRTLFYTFALGTVAGVTALVGACGRRHTVKRIAETEIIDLSGRWNDIDVQTVVDEMVKSALSEPWYTDFLVEHRGALPIVVVGDITNSTHEHIQAQTFIESIERAFIKERKIRVVEYLRLRNKLREERADQAVEASPETKKRAGKELGADFMMFGSIKSIVDTTEHRSLFSRKEFETVLYQVNLRLTNLETGETVWVGEKKIKKYVEKK